MYRIIFLFCLLMSVSCDDSPKKKSLEQMREETNKKRDSLANYRIEKTKEAEANKFKEIDSGQLIGKTLKTKYFYFVDGKGNIKGDTIYSNSDEFPTQSSFKLNRNSIYYSEGLGQTWKGEWTNGNIFFHRVSKTFLSIYIFEKNSKGLYRAIKLNRFDDENTPEMVYVFED